MIDGKWFLFATNSAAVVKALFECIPFSFSVLTGCTFFYCISSSLVVSNILWVTFTVIAVINLFAFVDIANTLVRILLIKRKKVFSVIRVALARAEMAFCSGVVGTAHFEAFSTAIAHGVKVIRKSGTNFCTGFLACFMTWLKTLNSFRQSNHLTKILPHFGRKFNIHDNPELLGGAEDED